ncbi:permease IIC component [Clostridia bacterium]|nr:permease IIC component [Clostridia bacterium]
MFKKFLEKVEEIGGKIGNMTYINVIRESFVQIMPIIILGSFATLINNVFCSPKNGLAQFAMFSWMEQFSPIFVAINYATMNMLAIYLVFLVAYVVGKLRKFDPIFCGIVGLISYIALVPNVARKLLEDGNEIFIENSLQVKYTNTQGMFLALLVGIFSAELLVKIVSTKKMQIKMPESVPRNVTAAFDVLFPSMTVVTLFGLFGFVFQKVSGMNISDGIYKMLQIPLEAIMQFPAGVVVLALLCQIFWLIGLHGAQIVGIVKDPIGLAAIAANLVAFEAGQPLPNIFTYTFWNTYVTIGGSGNTLALIIAIFLFSKKEEDKMIGRLAAIPALFNINEPLIFGLPLVLNPMFAIPFILAPVVSAIIGYVSTMISFAAPAYITVPFTIPPLINGLLSTSSFKTVITQFICIVVCVLIYIPFVQANNARKGTQEK